MHYFSSSSCATGGKSFLYSSMVVFFFMTMILFQIWVQATAIRIFPTTSITAADVVDNKASEETSSSRSLLQKYFHGRAFNFSRDYGNNGFADDKRRVPSCPDPLHN
ncbi:CLAVATA3/ESR (CLE)-related protein [Melia azedarach]|uniref:CLAVATA3/ESR (CLE)-related protein n=1 Tax=Melia azedarach TaxID=155640 RepID=A0ACC1XF01_MELAZ|nr:CLAVATA3/ESR (CLE)-related protein [Melia azedarach]